MCRYIVRVGKGDVNMASVSKPVTGAFILDSKKANEFFSHKRTTSIDAIKRFENRKTKSSLASGENK